MQPRTFWVKRDAGEAMPVRQSLAYYNVIYQITTVKSSDIFLSVFMKVGNYEGVRMLYAYYISGDKTRKTIVKRRLKNGKKSIGRIGAYEGAD